MANRGGPPPPQINFSSQWGEVLFQTNFVFVGTSLGHLSMKKKIQIGPTMFAQKESVGDPPSTPPWALSNNQPIFLTMKMHLISTKLSME